VKFLLRIKTKQQPDGTWKAWTGDARLVVYAETKVKAIDIMKMIFEDRRKYQTETLIPGTRRNNNKAECIFNRTDLMKLREVEVLLGQGKRVKEACQVLEISE
jgi:hypothetical protein